MSEVARPGPLISPGATLVPDLAMARHQHHGQCGLCWVVAGVPLLARPHITHTSASPPPTLTLRHTGSQVTGYQDVTHYGVTRTLYPCLTLITVHHHDWPRRQPLSLCIARPRPCPEAWGRVSRLCPHS